MLLDRWTDSGNDGEVWKGIVAGALGGLAATWVMSQFQAAVPAETFAKLLGETQEDEENDESGEPSTVKAASAISEGVFDHTLTKQEKKVAGPGVHYALGTSAGALYGGLAEVAPEVEAGAGLGFGAAFWLAADEATVPALGLSEPPWQHPPSTHVYGLASHLVYGLTTELVRRAVRAVL